MSLSENKKAESVLCDLPVLNNGLELMDIWSDFKRGERAAAQDLVQLLWGDCFIGMSQGQQNCPSFNPASFKVKIR